MVQSPIYIEGKVTCTDGSVYNSTQILTVTELKSGNTAVAKFLAEYSTGKTFKDVEIKLVCK
ncbi:MAG: hypothetical protein KA327_05730 [Pseudarcicella sp.]|nr:hypothetical protein [Pseudarcicella sp.]